MLYLILKFFMTLTIRGYFRSVTVRNAGVIPKNKAVLFASNHQSAFMDPIVVATQIRPQIYFLARGESFKNPIANGLFGMLNMIPIYRPSETPDMMHKNKEVFQKCFDHLGKRKNIIIFPEGTSKTEPRLRKIKTGAARIVLGAEDQYNFSLDAVIIPVGINYSDPHHFRSDLFINFGTPIPAEKYKEQWEKEGFAAAQSMTEELREGLEKVTINIEHETLDDLISDISDLYKSDLKKEAQVKRPKGEAEFVAQKDIIEGVQYFNTHEPDRIKGLEQKINTYRDTLKKHKLTDRQFKLTRKKVPFNMLMLYLILTFPLYLTGFVFNYIPYRLTGLITGMVGPRHDFTGSVRILVGFLVFALWFASLITCGFVFFPWWVGLATIFVAPFAGIFALGWAKRWFFLRDYQAVKRKMKTEKSAMDALGLLRDELINELEKGKEDYLRTNVSEFN